MRIRPDEVNSTWNALALETLDIALLQKYWADEASIAEMQQIDAWFAARPGRKEWYTQLRNGLGTAHDELAAAEVARRTQAILAVIHPAPAHHGVRRGVAILRRHDRHTLWKRMGVVALTACVAIGVYVGTTTVRRRLTPPHIYTTRVGQQATVQLADGSVVTLAPQTELVVGAGFGASHRDVTVRGQAYFDVHANQTRPFVVHAAMTATRVLGTQFTVRHYADDGDVVIAVRAGKVVTGNRKAIVLTNTMIAHVNDSTITMATASHLPEYIEWTQGRLVFNGVPGTEVAKVLSQWYGLTFRFADSTLAKLPLTGVFDGHDSREEVLQNLQLMLGARMVFDGNLVTVVPRRTIPTSHPLQKLQDGEHPSYREVGQ